MANIITASMGRNHIQSADAGAMQAGMFGHGRYRLDLGEQMAATMEDANTARIGTGGFMFDGRFVRLEDAETFKIANGTQAQYRKDLLVYDYRCDPSDSYHESLTARVIQGEASSSLEAAAEPSFTPGDILAGDLSATVKVGVVTLSGLTPAVDLSLPLVPTVSDLRDSVSRQWFVGNDSVNVTPSRDCDLIVFASRSNTWGYAGGDVQMSIDCPELTAVSKHIGKITLGDTIGRQLVSWAVFTGARAGVSYRPAIAYVGNPQQHDNETMLAITL